jgi:hypothetical protein
MDFKNLILLAVACCISTYAGEIEKPRGCYSSMLTEGAVQNPALQGALIRTSWAELEPKSGAFDFSAIEQQLQLLPQDKYWSLAVYAGWTSIDSGSETEPSGHFKQQRSTRRPLEPHTPPWMVSELGIETFTVPFRSQLAEMPKYWDPVVQERLAILMNMLAEEYKNDSRLKLVYVPQMTSNGIEGHFNGVPANTLLAAAGLEPGDEDEFEIIWTGAALSAIRSTSQAFNNKAVAFEVHELLGSSAIPEKIMTDILADPELKGQVGIGMWWISGKIDYQSDLVRAIERFPGDIYGQVIGRSDQAYRFPRGDYSAVFEQAEELGMRYIELWNYEFENHTHDGQLEAFNIYCKKQFPDRK